MDVLKQAIEDGDVAPLDRAVYDRIVATGVFDDMKIELIEGVLVPISPQGAPHSHAIKVLSQQLIRQLDGRADVLVQAPFAANERSEPEPDVQVVPVGEYVDDHPDRAFLVVEVAVSSQRKDKGRKVRLYAASHVDEYWIVDVPAGTVTVHADPAEGAWRTMTTYGRHSMLSVPGFPDVQIQIADILPRMR
jgi:Uma2 family endonuclease